MGELKKVQKLSKEAKKKIGDIVDADVAEHFDEDSSFMVAKFDAGISDLRSRIATMKKITSMQDTNTYHQC